MEPAKKLPDVSHLCFARISRQHCTHYEEDGYCCDCNQQSPEMCPKMCGQPKDQHLDENCSVMARPTNLVFDLTAHIHNQREFSFRTFGPPGQGQKPEGVIDHLQKEIKELRDDPTNGEEWTDVIILGIDGAIKSGYTPEQIVTMLMAKQVKNESRQWPDWRKVDLTQAIEHVRTEEKIKEKESQLPLNFDGNGTPISE